MKLCATIQSERGKVITKTANDYIAIMLTVKNGDNQSYAIGEIILDYNDDVANYKDVTQNEYVLKYLDYRAVDPIIITQGNVEP